MRALIATLFFLSAALPLKQPCADEFAKLEELRRQYAELSGAGDSKAALPFAVKAYNLGADLFERNSPTMAELAFELGKVHRHQGTDPIGIPLIERSIEIYERIDRKNQSTLIDPLILLGDALIAQRDVYEASGAHKRALRILRKQNDDADARIGFVLTRLVENMVIQGKLKKAERYAAEAYEFWNRRYPEDTELVNLAHELLAKIHEAREGSRDADKLLGEAETTDSEKSDEEPLPRNTRYVFAKPPPRGWRQGFAQVQFTVTAEGRVEDIVIVDSDPPGVFDKAVIRAVSRWRYEPLEKDGEYVDYHNMEATLTFGSGPDF